jgi:hypothetical protein
VSGVINLSYFFKQPLAREQLLKLHRTAELQQGMVDSVSTDDGSETEETVTGGKPRTPMCGAATPCATRGNNTTLAADPECVRNLATQRATQRSFEKRNRQGLHLYLEPVDGPVSIHGGRRVRYRQQLGGTSGEIARDGSEELAVRGQRVRRQPRRNSAEPDCECQVMRSGTVGLVASSAGGTSSAYR